MHCEGDAEEKARPHAEDVVALQVHIQSRKKLARASGCLLQYVGLLAFMSGTKKQREKPLEAKVPLGLLLNGSEGVGPEYIYTRDVEPGQHVVLGSGSDMAAVFFLRRISELRPDPLRALLVRQPALLAAGDSVALFLRRLRTELGDAAAREVRIATRLLGRPATCRPQGRHPLRRGRVEEKEEEEEASEATVERERERERETSADATQ